MTVSRGLAGLVPAAGASTRLGRPKQTLEWQGASFLAHTVNRLLPLCDAGVTVVTGAVQPEVASELEGYDSSVRAVHNPDWHSGMGSSIAVGIAALQSPSVKAVLIMAVDLPSVTGDDLARLAAAWQGSPRHPAAAEYNGVVGMPVIFPAHCFAHLLQMRGEDGARGILLAYQPVTAVAMPAAALDVDDAADLAAINRMQGVNKR